MVTYGRGQDEPGWEDLRGKLTEAPPAQLVNCSHQAPVSEMAVQGRQLSRGPRPTRKPPADVPGVQPPLPQVAPPSPQGAGPRPGCGSDEDQIQSRSHGTFPHQMPGPSGP
ncbi:uncharacterized protein LOC116158313 isoform X2 [Camelus dromedarius]|uniref:Protein transport protein sec31-like isoform X2 n=1 Tax=Camelus bactrianus TaxID=9837 RepID=A0A9W3GEY8_CAMBA|nr:protein transport protein sec31-like isoform X2 [Camelus bactrianus]